MNIWDKKGLPHKGWRLKRIADLGEGVETCEMCGQSNIRYFCKMSHPQYAETVWVGVNCADELRDDYNCSEINKLLKRRSKRKATWAEMKWKESRKGFTKKKEGAGMTVFSNTKGVWSYVFNFGNLESKYSDISFSSSLLAKEALFEDFWRAVLEREGNIGIYLRYIRGLDKDKSQKKRYVDIY